MTWIEFNGSKMVQDQRTLEKTFMGLSRGTASLQNGERECVNKSAEAARHMHMVSNHNYFADPHRISSQYLSDVKSNSMVDAVDRHTVPARCFYGNNLTIGPSTSNYSAFAPAARPSDRSGDGTGRQQFICFNNSQEPRLDKVSDNYQFTPHGGGLQNGHGMPGLHSNSSAIESLKDQSRLKLKMFPFMAPAFHEPGLRTMTEQQVVATGPSLCAPRPTFPSSSRPVMASESRTKTSNGQLTIFYKGQVNVYNNVLPAKVQDIMLMAAAHDSLPEPLELSIKTSDSHVNLECEKVPHVDLNIGGQPEESKANRAGANLMPIRIRMMQEDEAESSFVEEEPFVPQALPQARKASLARFLERRKERLMARSPYSVERSSN